MKQKRQLDSGLLVFLLFVGLTLAAAMRPGVDKLSGYGVPRSVGVLAHFAALGVAIGLLLWLAVPPAIDQLSAAVGNVPTSKSELRQAANQSTGLRHEFLVGVFRSSAPCSRLRPRCSSA